MLILMENPEIAFVVNLTPKYGVETRNQSYVNNAV